jgi:predicted enzyme related to lactoylglutathione lyase
MAQGSYNHVEIPADDVDRAKRFYERVFGWNFTTIPGFDDYELYSTTADRSGVGGGIGKRGVTAGRQVRNYVSVDAIHAALPKVTSNGGRLVSPKEEVMGQGWYAVVTDSEGNEFALWQADSNARQG